VTTGVLQDVTGEDHLGTERVMRGGSWNNDPRNVRAANRNANHSSNRNSNLGFRLARAPARPDGRIGPGPHRARPRVRAANVGSGAGVLVGPADAGRDGSPAPL